jgi:hypothetical protein
MKGKVRDMVNQVMTVLLIAGLAAPLAARRGEMVARFDGGIGVIPASGPAGVANADGTFPNVARNIVRGVSPAPGPWRIGSLEAEVDSDGRIRVRGRGLLLAGGNSIGQNANQRVFATLTCEAVPLIERNSDAAGVPLDTNGDFRINDVLNAPTPECASPVLLIRSAASGVWFAAGVPTSIND